MRTIAVMVLREDGDAVIAIGQPAHAWVSGQLARAWGNDRFPAPEPREEVCLAAEQHDIGMAAWDAEPRVNPETGRPLSFMEMPTSVHLELWTRAPRLALVQGRYAALLVSLHGTLLYEYRDFSSAPEETRRAVNAYRADQWDLQDGLVRSLREDPIYAPYVEGEALERNRRLVAAWDAISLMLCMGRLPYTVAGAERMELTALDDEGVRTRLDPWPFDGDRLLVRCEGRRLEGRFQTDAALREALAEAPWRTLEIELVP
jgi:uncharacterized protein DUF3891